MKLLRFLWLAPLAAISIWALFAEQVQAISAEHIQATPTPLTGLPPSVIVPKTHFPEIITGAIVIVLIILTGVLIRQRKS